MTSPRPNRDQLVLLGAPLLALGVYLMVCDSSLGHSGAFVAALTLVVASWWIFEPIPIPFTSLLPLALLPLAGVITPSEVAEAVGSPLILLLLGGFILSQALEKSGAHRRLALGMIRGVGSRSGKPLVFGFMLAAAVLSMWISNTATCLMLLPIALAALEQIRDERLETAVILGIAYAASVGGTGTPIGTPPNLIFLQVYGDITGTKPAFSDYLRWALPVIVVFIPIIALWLTRGMRRGERLTLPDSGPWRFEERRTLVIVALTALAWITRSEPFGGWSTWFGLNQANDASVALLACVIMAIVPDGRGGKLLDWKHAVRIPWGILLLFGSGIALAKGFVASGISPYLGAQLGTMLETLPLVVVLLGICLSVSFLTEVTSNTATAALLMPILASAALGAGIDPLLIMFPAAMSASCAFMLPVATGPNAVMFGSGKLRVGRMVREGIAINIVGALLIASISWALL